MICQSLEHQLTLFREKYSSVRCYVGSDNIVYSCSRGYSDKAVVSANKLIGDLGLDLVAVGTIHLSKDSYIIKSNEIDAL